MDFASVEYYLSQVRPQQKPNILYGSAGEIPAKGDYATFTIDFSSYDAGSADLLEASAACVYEVQLKTFAAGTGGIVPSARSADWGPAGTRKILKGPQVGQSNVVQVLLTTDVIPGG